MMILHVKVYSIMRFACYFQHDHLERGPRGTCRDVEMIDDDFSVFNPQPERTRTWSCFKTIILKEAQGALGGTWR